MNVIDVPRARSAVSACPVRIRPNVYTKSRETREIPRGSFAEQRGNLANPTDHARSVEDIGAENAPAVGDFLAEIRITDASGSGAARDQPAGPRMIRRAELIVIPAA